MDTQAKCPQCETPLTTQEQIQHNACDDCWGDFIKEEDFSIDGALFYD